MYIFIILNQFFISIIIGLIYITGYSFLILLLIINNNIWNNNSIYTNILFLVLIFIFFLSKINILYYYTNIKIIKLNSIYINIYYFQIY